MSKDKKFEPGCLFGFIGIILLFFILPMYSIKSDKKEKSKYKYCIKIPAGEFNSFYYTNNYKINNNSIIFINRDGNEVTSVNYTIMKQ